MEDHLKSLKELDETKWIDIMNVFQKACIQWDAEGDENMKFSHGLLKQRRKGQMIQGFMKNGNWCSEP